MKTFTKDPEALLDYVFDWTKWLGLDTITLATCEVIPGNDEVEEDEEGLLVVDDITIEDGKVTVWVSGGTVNKQYLIVCRIETEYKRHDGRHCIFEIQPK